MPMIDYQSAKRSKSGAKYAPQAGYTPSDYWSLYAAQFAQDGSDDQLIAAMTKSVPDAWLKASGFADPDTMGNVDPNKNIFRNLPREWEGTPALDRGEDYYMNLYSRGLQSRLRNDFKNSKKGIENQGVANLRDQSQDALSQDLKGIDADANSRGILYSGKRQAARGAAAAARADELDQVVGDYSRQLSDTERQLNSDVFSSEMDSAFKQADLNDITSGNFYNKLQRDVGTTQNQAQAAIGLGDGLGSLSGALAGRMKRTAGR